MTVTATATDTTVGLRYCAMVGVGVTMQGGVRQGCHMILPVLLGDRIARRRLIAPKVITVFVAILYSSSSRGPSKVKTLTPTVGEISRNEDG